MVAICSRPIQVCPNAQRLHFCNLLNANNAATDNFLFIRGPFKFGMSKIIVPLLPFRIQTTSEVLVLWFASLNRLLMRNVRAKHFPA